MLISMQSSGGDVRLPVLQAAVKIRRRIIPGASFLSWQCGPTAYNQAYVADFVAAQRGYRPVRAAPGDETKVLRRGTCKTAVDSRPIGSVSARGMLALLMAMAQLLSLARASDAVDVTLIAEVRTEVQLGGRNLARLAPATVLQQGQEVFYTVRIQNSSAAAARDVVVVQRLPQNTFYVPKSAGGPGAEITFSVDGGQSFGKEGKLTVTDQTAAAGGSNRTVLMRPATPQDYTHIRWRLRNSLAPGAVALARFRAVFR